MPLEFFFGDERCVPPDNKDSNYKMVMDTLFTDGLPEHFLLHRIKGELKAYEKAAESYSELIPESIDLLLLSLGEDGHIASIFPNDDDAFKEPLKMRPVKSPKPPDRRITITPLVIQSARQVIVFVKGANKGKILAEMLNEPENIVKMPARILREATWLLDREAFGALKDFY